MQRYDTAPDCFDLKPCYAALRPPTANDCRDPRMPCDLL